jgi:hypothetical protein
LTGRGNGSEGFGGGLKGEGVARKAEEVTVAEEA